MPPEATNNPHPLQEAFRKRRQWHRYKSTAPKSKAQTNPAPPSPKLRRQTESAPPAALPHAGNRLNRPAAPCNFSFETTHRFQPRS